MSDIQKLGNLIRTIVREELEYTKKQIITEIVTNAGGQASQIRESSTPSIFNKYSNTSTQMAKPIEEKPQGVSTNFFQMLAEQKANDPDFIAQKMAS
jgi:hypothetical protein